MRELKGSERDAYIQTLWFVRESVTPKHKASWTKFYKKYDYCQFDNGIVVSFDRPHIKNEIWYDDETEDPLGGTPDEQRKVWIEHNMSLFPDDGAHFLAHRDELTRYDSDRYQNTAMLWWYYGKDGKSIDSSGVRFGRSNPDDIKADETRGMHHIQLTAEETWQVVEFQERRRATFRKRLERHWKRYEGTYHITSRGYWANR